MPSEKEIAIDKLCQKAYRVGYTCALIKAIEIVIKHLEMYKDSDSARVIICSIGDDIAKIKKQPPTR